MHVLLSFICLKPVIRWQPSCYYWSHCIACLCKYIGLVGGRKTMAGQKFIHIWTSRMVSQPISGLPSLQRFYTEIVAYGLLCRFQPGMSCRLSRKPQNNDQSPLVAPSHSESNSKYMYKKNKFLGQHLALCQTWWDTCRAPVFHVRHSKVTCVSLHTSIILSL